MKTFVSAFVSLLVGLGFGYLVFHNGAAPQVKETPLGGEYNINKTQFINGFTAGSTNQFSVSSAGALTTTAYVSGSSNRGTVTTNAAGTGTTTVTSGAVCVANNMTATGTISTYASTTGTTLTVKGTPSQSFQFVCW